MQSSIDRQSQQGAGTSATCTGIPHERRVEAIQLELFPEHRYSPQSERNQSIKEVRPVDVEVRHER